MVDIISTILTVLLVVISVLMIIIILLQSNRAAGGMFSSGAQTAFGAGSADALTKITGGFAGAFLLICFGLAMIRSSKRASDAAAEQLKKDIAPITAPAPTPGAPGADKPAANNAAPAPAAPAAKPAAAAAPAPAPVKPK